MRLSLESYKKMEKMQSPLKHCLMAYGYYAGGIFCMGGFVAGIGAATGGVLLTVGSPFRRLVDAVSGLALTLGGAGLAILSQSSLGYIWDRAVEETVLSECVKQARRYLQLKPSAFSEALKAQHLEDTQTDRRISALFLGCLAASENFQSYICKQVYHEDINFYEDSRTLAEEAAHHYRDLIATFKKE